MKFKISAKEYKTLLEHTQSDIDFIDSMAKYGFELNQFKVERRILVDLINHGYLYHYNHDYYRKPRGD